MVTGLHSRNLFQSRALNATGRPIFFNSCEGGKEDPWLWMKQYANSWRTGPDHHDNWESTAAIIDHNADLGGYAGIRVNVAVIYESRKCIIPDTKIHPS